jgi:hypothetical protein
MCLEGKVMVRVIEPVLLRFLLQRIAPVKIQSMGGITFCQYVT